MNTADEMTDFQQYNMVMLSEQKYLRSVHWVFRVCNNVTILFFMFTHNFLKC